MILKRLFCFIFALLMLFSSTLTLAQPITVEHIGRRLFSQSAILIDADTGQILYEKDMHRVLRPASITKVMTALLALENGELTDTVKVTRSALRPLEPTAMRLPVFVDEELTLEDALYSIAVISANDTSNAIAEHIGGSLSEFVKMMNERAKELGALNTSFANAHGMPYNNHLTTAYDMALIAQAAVNTPGFNEIFSAREHRIPPTNKRRTPRVMKNMNRMITGAFTYRDLISSKTGWTRSSQYTYFTAAKRDGRTLVGIVMRSENIDDKYRDMTMLLDFGFNEFQAVSFSVEELENFPLTDDYGNEIAENLFIEEGFSCLIPKSLTKEDVIVNYVLENSSIENVFNIRVVFRLNSTAWDGYTQLGEVSGYANVVERVIEIREPAVPETPPRPPQESDNAGGDASSGDGFVTDASGGDLTPHGNSFGDTSLTEQLTDERTGLTDTPEEMPHSPLWQSILKDAGIILVPVTILLCYFIYRARKSK